MVGRWRPKSKSGVGARLPTTRTQKQIVCAILAGRAYAQDGRRPCAAGIECRAGGRRALVPLDRQTAGLNGSAWPVFGWQCPGCDSTALAWRRFTTLAEVNACADGVPGLEWRANISVQDGNMRLLYGFVTL